MNKNMIAYNSKVLPFIFLFCAILTSIVGYFAVRELYKYKILGSFFFILVSSIVLFAFVWTVTNKNVAFKIENDILIIYKHKKVYEIKMTEIRKVRLAVNNIGFDCTIYHKDSQKIGMHFLVKKFRKTNRKFIDIIDVYGIEKEFYSLSSQH